MKQNSRLSEQRFSRIEHRLEALIFASRWLMAPMYVGLIVALLMLVVFFFVEIVQFIFIFSTEDEIGIILFSLTLIDLSLAGNLILIVILSGYENFVSKIDVVNRENRLTWMGTLDFSGLKIKLATSIVAISGIHLLKVFMNIDKYTNDQLMWLTSIHLAFVASGLCFAVMDFVHVKTLSMHKRSGDRDNPKSDLQ